MKRKTKFIPQPERSQWWFVLHADESLLVALEEKWMSVCLQTSWKIEPCFKPAEVSTEENTPSSVTPVNKSDPHPSHNTSSTLDSIVPFTGSNGSATTTAVPDTEPNDPPVTVQDVHNSPPINIVNSTPMPENSRHCSD